MPALNHWPHDQDGLFRCCDAAQREADGAPAGALSQDECDAIGTDGRDGRGWITEGNLTGAERDRLTEYRAAADPFADAAREDEARKAEPML